MESESSPIDCSSSKASLDMSNGNYLDASKVNFTAKEKYYYRSVYKFYKKLSSDKIKLMISIIESESDISLRLLDWLVTKYADKNIINIKNVEDDTDDMNVHISYKAQLKSYRKRYFDPFKRYKKFYYIFNIDGKEQRFLTTIGQLNFFKWSFKNGIIKYVKDNIEKVSESMISSNKQDQAQAIALEQAALKQEKQDKSKKAKNAKIDKVDSKKDHIVIKKKHATITAKRIKTPATSESKEKTIVVSFE